MKYEYKDGKDARNNFEEAMKSLFKAPKTLSIRVKVKHPKKDASDRKTEASDKNSA